MFDITSLSSVKSNPLVAGEFVRHLSAYELANAVGIGLKNEEFILNEECIIEGIIGSGDTAKILLLASGSKLDDFAKCDNFLKIYGRGEIFKSALLSNNRIDWYCLFTFHGYIAEMVANDILKEDSKLRVPFFKNPRMDRKLVAEIIKGGEYNIGRESILFNKIGLGDRYFAAYNSVDVVEIRSRDFYGKDSPDSNELYFSKPFDAILILLRDLFIGWEENKNFERFYTPNIIYYIEKIDINIDFNDWVDNDERDRIDSVVESGSRRYELYHEKAFDSVIIFFDEHTSSFGSSDKKPDNSDLMEHYGKVCSTISILTKLLFSYGCRDRIDLYLDKLINSDNWVIRASAYSFLVKNSPIDEEFISRLVGSLRADKLAFLWSIYSSSNSVFISRLFPRQFEVVSDIFDSISFDEDMRRFFDSIREFIFGVQLRELDQDDLESAFRRGGYRGDINFEKYIKEPDSESSPKVDGIPFRIGKVVGGIFRGS